LPDIRTFLDGFSGTTRVSQAAAQLGYSVISADISEWSQVFATCYLQSKKPDSFYQKILDELNSLPGYHGWYSDNYGGDIDEEKKPFQLHNTRKLDAIRDKIDALDLPWEDTCVLLTSLILALDKVDNTLGHYVAYLKKWSARSYKTLHLELPQRMKNRGTHLVKKANIFQTIDECQPDIAYFDPPYGSNNEKMPASRVRYASYYHIWKTIILNDKPRLFGKASRREDSRDTVSASIFEEFRTDSDGHFIAMKAIEKLLRCTQSRYILLSYSSGGRATKNELHDIIQSTGKLLHFIAIDYKKNVMANMSWTQEWLNTDVNYQEYLFLIQKN